MGSATPTTTTSTDPPTLRYKGDLPWLQSWVDRWRASAPAGSELLFEHDARAEHDFVFLEPEQVAVATGDRGDLLPNSESTGAEALARLRRHLGSPGWLRCWSTVAGGPTALRAHHALLFRWPRLWGELSWAFHGRDLRAPTYVWSGWLFMRMLGLCLLCATLSWWSQLAGLVGEQGILPAGEWLQRVVENGAAEGWTDGQRMLKVPTVLWHGATDGYQHAVALITTLASLLVVLNVAEGWMLLVAWAGYLSLMTVGQVFSGYQWDALLLEAAFAGLFCASWLSIRPRSRGDRREGEIGLWTVRVLIAKLMFLSGLVKLQSGDVTWANHTALEYHYWTQPIPAATSWVAHHLPAAVHEATASLTLAVELVLPVAVFGPRRLRLLAATMFIALMIGIGATGNYGFFNLLTVALCIPLLDDRALRRLIPARWRPPHGPPPRRRSHTRRWVAWPLRICAAALIALSIGRVWQAADPQGVPDWLSEAHSDLSALHISNPYGLFASMTLDRPEIRIEGSRDGHVWAPYVFEYKPGPVERSPVFIGPHMPRLDWQMWFAALRGECGRTRWYVPLLRSLLQGRPEVTALMAPNPFTKSPPTYIRSTLYDYYFTTPQERAATGHVWRAIERRPFCPTVQLDRRGRVTRAKLPSPRSSDLSKPSGGVQQER